MTPKMKADLERMNALRAELEQLETEYADAIRNQRMYIIFRPDTVLRWIIFLRRKYVRKPG